MLLCFKYLHTRIMRVGALMMKRWEVHLPARRPPAAHVGVGVLKRLYGSKLSRLTCSHRAFSYQLRSCLRQIQSKNTDKHMIRWHFHKFHCWHIRFHCIPHTRQCLKSQQKKNLLHSMYVFKFNTLTIHERMVSRMSVHLTKCYFVSNICIHV